MYVTKRNFIFRRNWIDDGTFNATGAVHDQKSSQDGQDDASNEGKNEGRAYQENEHDQQETLQVLIKIKISNQIRKNSKDLEQKKSKSCNILLIPKTYYLKLNVRLNKLISNVLITY